MTKKKNPHCEIGIMQNCRDSPNRREKPCSHFPVLFPTPDKPPTPLVPLSRHTAPMCLLLGCLPLPVFGGHPSLLGERQMSPRRGYSGRRRGHCAALICVFKSGVVSAPPPESLCHSQYYFFCCVCCNLLSA